MIVIYLNGRKIIFLWRKKERIWRYNENQMWIKKLQLNDFRNYPSLNISFDEEINFLVGENGVGKTNILEAISILSSGKSFVTSEEKNCIAQGKEFAKLVAIYQQERERSIKIVLSKEGKKIEKEHKEVHKLSQIVGSILTVTFSPKDVRFFIDAPQEKRKFIDYSLSMLEPYYLSLLSQYRELLKNRNALLKNSSDINLFYVVEEQMIPLQKEITLKRRQFIHDLEKEMNDLYKYFDEEDIKLQYRNMMLDFVDNNNFVSLMKEKYEESRKQDIIRGSTSLGIHKDDMRLIYKGNDIAIHGSRGQNRIASLLLKIALARFFKKRSETPILLLDDVFSELDAMHIEKISELLKTYQVFITGTEVPHQFRQANIYEIKCQKIIRRN